jgi:tRNA(adenine34) deaminase
MRSGRRVSVVQNIEPSENPSLISRRRVLRNGMSVGVATALGSAVRQAWAEGSVVAEDEKFMSLAIEEAAKADFPFGAVIVRNGEVLARGRNLGKTNQDPTAHGEIVAIRNFLGTHPPEALHGTTLYTSGEPCVMCIGAILWSGIERVVFAASIEQLATRIDQIMITSQTVAYATTFSRLKITGGVLAEEAMALFDRLN